jgi:hypothetical protein
VQHCLVGSEMCIRDRIMPNWCDNNLTVTGDAESLQKFLAAITNADESITILKNLVPFPTELEGKDILDKEGNVFGKAFTDDGYSWCLRNWGTKWGDCETQITVNGDYLVIRYETAWSPALEGLEQVSLLFPTLTFQTDWVEEGMQSIGAASFQNGNGSVHDVPDSDFPSLESDENGEEDWQAWSDAISDLREKAVEQV